MDEPTLPLTGLSPVLDKEIIARFDGSTIFSNSDLLVLREIQQWIGLAASLDDLRALGRIYRILADRIAFRMVNSDPVSISLFDRKGNHTSVSTFCHSPRHQEKSPSRMTKGYRVKRDAFLTRPWTTILTNTGAEHASVSTRRHQIENRGDTLNNIVRLPLHQYVK